MAKVASTVTLLACGVAAALFRMTRVVCVMAAVMRALPAGVRQRTFVECALTLARHAWPFRAPAAMRGEPALTLGACTTMLVEGPMTLGQRRTTRVAWRQPPAKRHAASGHGAITGTEERTRRVRRPSATVIGTTAMGPGGVPAAASMTSVVEHGVTAALALMTTAMRVTNPVMPAVAFLVFHATLIEWATTFVRHASPCGARAAVRGEHALSLGACTTRLGARSMILVMCRTTSGARREPAAKRRAASGQGDIARPRDPTMRVMGLPPSVIGTTATGQGPVALAASTTSLTM